MSTLDHANATTIVLTGLSLCCFNPDGDGRWEVAFIRYPKRTARGNISTRYHKFTLEVAKKNQIGGSMVPPLIIDDIKCLEFTFTGAVNKYGAGDFPDGRYTQGPSPFDRNNASNDIEDFRWVPHLPEDYGLGEIALKKPEDFTRKAGVALVYIPKAVLYTKKSEQPVRLQAASLPDDQLDAATSEFGHINQEVKGDIFIGSGGSITIKFTAKTGDFTLELPVSTSDRYIITLSNKEPDTEPESDSVVKGDLERIYDVVKVASANRATLWGLSPNQNNRPSSRAPCEPICLSGVSSFNYWKG